MSKGKFLVYSFLIALYAAYAELSGISGRHDADRSQVVANMPTPTARTGDASIRH